MEENALKHRLNLKFTQDDYLAGAIEAFLIDRKVQNMAAGTLRFYRIRLSIFLAFCEGQEITQITQIDATLIRKFMMILEEEGHNPGGQHTFYRVVKTFLKWWEGEAAPPSWKNPISKVKAPKIALEPLEPVALPTVKKLINQCEPDFRGLRDKAIFLFLIDTGVRAAELLSIDLEDINALTGAVLIRVGKGRKPRAVFLGKVARKALRLYLKERKDNHPALWITSAGERMVYSSLRSSIARRARQAGVPAPYPHQFRRAFALNMLRAGVDVFTLQKFMGHADLQVLRRYLAQNNQDLQEAHNRASPGDHLY